jgi:hypothetical protein
MALNRARVVGDIDVTNELAYFLTVEFFDSAAPATVLWSEPMTVPIGATTAQLQAKVIERGQAVRAALATQAAARAAVPAGTTVTVP